jgi:hypothetical protein
MAAVVLDVQMDAGRCNRRVPQVFLDEGRVGVDVRVTRVGTAANRCVDTRRSVAAPSGSSGSSASRARRTHAWQSGSSAEFICRVSRQTMLVARPYIRMALLYPCKRSGHMVFLKKLTVVRAAH